MLKGNMLGYVFIGGVLGTMVRYVIFTMMVGLAEYPTYELIALFTVNLIGALFLGITARHPYFQLETCRNLWGEGFAGSFTTMSALTMFVDYQGLSWEIFAMLILGFFAYALGFRIGRKANK